VSAVYCYSLEQGSPEWHEARAGIPTASGMSNLIDPCTIIDRSADLSSLFDGVESKSIIDAIYTPSGSISKVARKRLEKIADADYVFNNIDKIQELVERQHVSESTSDKVTTYLCNLIAERIETPNGDGFSSEWTDRGHELEPDARSAYEFITDQEVAECGIVYSDASYSASASPDGLVGDDGGIEIKCLKLANHIKHLIAGTVPPDYVIQCYASLWVTGRKWWDFISYHPSSKPLIVRVERDQAIMAVFDEVIPAFCEKLDARHAEIIA